MSAQENAFYFGWGDLSLDEQKAIDSLVRELYFPEVELALTEAEDAGISDMSFVAYEAKIEQKLRNDLANVLSQSMIEVRDLPQIIQRETDEVKAKISQVRQFDSIQLVQRARGFHDALLERKSPKIAGRRKAHTSQCPVTGNCWHTMWYRYDTGDVRGSMAMPKTIGCGLEYGKTHLAQPLQEALAKLNDLAEQAEWLLLDNKVMEAASLDWSSFGRLDRFVTALDHADAFLSDDCSACYRLRRCEKSQVTTVSVDTRSSSLIAFW